MMSLPLFYVDHTLPDNGRIVLSEDTSRHVVQVLRMKTGERLQLTDGKGNLWLTSVVDDHKKKTEVQIEKHVFKPAPSQKLAIAICLVKNNSRFEWFLEKATEIGITEIIPLLSDRTEKQHFRYDRMKGILISAMLQSQQVWMPHLHEPLGFSKVVQQNTYEQKFVGHCEEGNKQTLAGSVDKSRSALMLIGPEGDFTKEEIALALDNNFIPVTLGDTRLRTETAGIVAATLLKYP